MTLGLSFLKKKSDEEIKKDLEKKRDEIVRRAEALRPFIQKEKTGWSVYVELIENYIEACKKRKSITAIDRLLPGVVQDDRVLHELKLIDHEIYILSWVLQFPFDEIEKADQIIKEGNK